MNREIKFRGKRVDNGEWVYGDLLKPFKSQFYVLDYSKFDYDCFEHIGEVAEQFEVVPETIGQFTGLLDKNGKKIYEGDIVNLFYENDDDVYVIEWHNYTSRFEINSKTLSVDFDSYYSYELEVIGNIHDNPEILEVTQNN